VDTFKAITATMLSVFSAISLEYFLKFRPGLAEKFVLKADCQRASDQLHNENRQDHQLLFEEIKNLRSEIMKTQGMILEVKK